MFLAMQPVRGGARIGTHLTLSAVRGGGCALRITWGVSRGELTLAARFSCPFLLPPSCCLQGILPANPSECRFTGRTWFPGCPQSGFRRWAGSARAWQLSFPTPVCFSSSPHFTSVCPCQVSEGVIKQTARGQARVAFRSGGPVTS